MIILKYKKSSGLNIVSQITNLKSIKYKHNSELQSKPPREKIILTKKIKGA